MTARWIALVLLAAPLPAAADDAAPTPQHLDLSEVTAIRITGDASAINVTAADDQPYEAALGGERTGWFAKWYSSWFDHACPTASHMRIDRGTLYVDAQPASWLEPESCRVRFTANVRKDSAIAIEQKASEVKLTGDYSAVSFDGGATDFAITGHADTLALNASQMRTTLSFDRTEGRETIALAAQSQDVHLTFAAGTRIDYAVDATAALVDSALPKTPGARPDITVKGQFVRVTIR